MSRKTLTPKISLGSWAFSFGPFASNPWSFQAFCKYTAEAGYDGVEINGFRPHPHPADYETRAKRSGLKQYLDDLGLGISGYAPDFHSVPPAVTDAEAYLAIVQSCVDFMVDLDIKILRVDTVTPPEVLDPQQYELRFDHLSTTWRKAAALCAQAGITLVWEYEPGFWLNKPSEVLRLVQQVERPAFKVLFDTSHSYMGSVVGARHTGYKDVLAGGLAQYARMLAPHIGHLHLIDSDGSLHDNETSAHTPFGRGHINFPEVLQALGPALQNLQWWCVDFCFCPTTEKDALSAPAYLRALAQGIET